MPLGKSLIFFARYLNRFGVLHGGGTYFANYISKKEQLSISIPGLSEKIFLRNGTSDVRCFNQIFLEEDYNFEIDFRPKIIIDCGSNIGLSALFFQKKYPGVTIIAVEPEPSNFKMLLKNTRNYKNIQCLNYAVWNQNVKLAIAENMEIDKWGFTMSSHPNELTKTIPAITIDEIMKRYNFSEVDILKMDIEGSEKEVFSSGYEAWLPRTKVIMIELHDREKKGCAKTFFQTLFTCDFSMNQYFKGETLMCINNSYL